MVGPADDNRQWSRRDMIKATAGAAGFASSVVCPTALAQVQPVWRTAVEAYLKTLARPDGGYVWHQDARTHLTPTFAAIGTYRLLGRNPPRALKSAEFLRTHHPAALKKLERAHRAFEFQQIQGLVWLNEDVGGFRELVAEWTGPQPYPKQYEQHGYPVFQSEAAVFLCRGLLGMPLQGLAPKYTGYLDSRRRANGSFNNTPAQDGSDGHVMNTWWGLQALRVLGRDQERQEETIAWLQACQLPSGGFTYCPHPEFAAVADVAYTWAAVLALRQLSAAPKNADDCLAYLRSLYNRSGGFGDRQGWRSNPVATYYAVAALNALDAMGDDVGWRPQPQQLERPLPAGLKVFSIQIEAHGQGSPSEAVDLASSLHIHLWGAKNAKQGWIERAQEIADERKVPVQFFTSNEEYGTWVDVPGLGTYSHTSDVIAPAGAEIGPALANAGVVTWPAFRQRRLAPLEAGRGRMVWQFGQNEELVRIFLDDSLERGGYAAISTFHFGNPDFTNSEPFLNRYRGQIPFVALQDAHGKEAWWFADMTTGFRTLFLATEPTWENWLLALERDWVAAVRHDAVSRDSTWMHGGRSDVLEFMRTHEDQWRWWDNPEIQRPMVSIVAVRPGDKFEVGRPDEGITLRVRCAWQNTTQGLPKQRLAELVRLVVDGDEVTPILVTVDGGKKPNLQDHYHVYHMPRPSAGEHSAVVRVRVLATGAELERSIRFSA